MVEMEIEDEEEAYGELEDLQFSDNLDDELDMVLPQAAEVIRSWLEDYTPRRTGLTATSWRVIAFGRDDYEITNTNEPIITFLTEGTRPHDIYGSPLHWVDELGGDHFATHVWHPGTEPIDIVDMAMISAEPELDQLFDASVDSAWRESVG